MNRDRASWVRSITLRMRTGSTRSIASRRLTCALTWVTASSGTVNIIAKSRAPHSPARNSVCPWKSGRDMRVASLFIGRVTIPATLPAKASRIAQAT